MLDLESLGASGDGMLPVLWGRSGELQLYRGLPCCLRRYKATRRSDSEVLLCVQGSPLLRTTIHHLDISSTLALSPRHSAAVTRRVYCRPNEPERSPGQVLHQLPASSPEIEDG